MYEGLLTQLLRQIAKIVFVHEARGRDVTAPVLRVL
jgi:hypothetical protein